MVVTEAAGGMVSQKCCFKWMCACFAAAKFAQLVLGCDPDDSVGQAAPSVPTLAVTVCVSIIVISEPVTGVTVYAILLNTTPVQSIRRLP